MSLHHSQYRAYATATQTVAKTRQVVMLYDGALRFVKQAVEAIERKDYEARYNLLMRACEIIMGLQGSLDHEKGGEIAVLLHNYYSSLDARLLAVHRTNDVAACHQVMKELKQMRDAWDHVDRLQTAPRAHESTEVETPRAPFVPPMTPALNPAAVAVSA